jgi:hypothetical protein
MNEIRRRDRDAEQIARARQVVSGHPMPDFISGFDVRLGESDGDPALFVIYWTRDDNENWLELFLSEEWERRAKEYRKLDDAVIPRLIDVLEDRYPYSLLVPEGQKDSYPR